MADIQLRLGSDVLVVQGAMGTVLEAEGFGPAGETCYPFLSLTEPETVEDLHRRYLDAGADCALTNTFLATSSRLATFGLEGQAEQINRMGVRLARGLGFQHVLAAMGPCGIEAETGDEGGDAVAVRRAAAVENYAEQAAYLALEGPDALLLETFTELDDALAALEGVRRSCDVPVIACLSFGTGEDGALATCDGVAPAEAARALQDAGAVAVGCNCMAIDDTVAAVEQMAAGCTAPLVALPSAGIPVKGADGAPVWPAGPDDFAAASVRLLRAGARVIGSCCGSTPACTGAIYATVGGVQFPE